MRDRSDWLPDWLEADGVRRFVQSSLKTGLAGEVLGGAPLQALRALIEEGIGAGAIHRLHAANHPERTALVDAHRSLTYREADREIDRLAGALQGEFGVGPERPLAMMLENRAEYVAAWFATFRLGVAGAHISYRATADELAYHLEHSGARLVLCSEQTRPTVERLMEQRRDLALFAVDVDAERHAAGEHAGRIFSYRRLVEQGGWRAPDARQKGARSANIVYTSGTTGQPKGTVRDMTSFGISDLFCIIDRLPVEAGDRHLVSTPIYHSGGQVFTLLNAALGATVHLLPHFEPEATLEAMAEHRINSLFLVPTMIRRLLELPDEVHDRCPTPDLRVLISGAAPFPEALRRRAIQRFGASTVHDFYGATEMGWVTLIDGLEMLAKPGSVGRPIARQELKIRDDEGRELPPGEVGQIWVRSPHSMSGYLRDEDANREFRREGWVTVEDLGYVDEEGYLFLAGRSRDMVITGGVNVYPVEIEDVLARHPRLEDVGVIGVEDPEWGEKLVAYVKCADEHAAEHAAEPPEVDELEAWVRQRLAGYKVPREWRLVDELPRNPTGKIVKHRLEEEYRAGEASVRQTQ